MTARRAALEVARLVRRVLVLLALFYAAESQAVAAPRAPLVLAAASLQESLTTVAKKWAASGHAMPVVSFAASSALARQIEAGAPADLFISADQQWMNELQKRGLLASKSRSILLGNDLVLIAPLASHIRLPIAKGLPLARALGTGRLAIADPAAVPAGIYAEAALKSLGAWGDVKGRLAPAENVRAALAFVERGDAPLGIVYATDAFQSKKVRIIGRFPATSHEAILYPVARLASSTSVEAESFLHFLVSPAAKAVFRQFGFTTP